MRIENLNIEQSAPALQGINIRNAAETAINRLVKALGTWRERTQQRALLAELSPALRRDIGLTEADVWKEVRKSPWEA